jgi:hypothetical protein
VIEGDGVGWVRLAQTRGCFLLQRKIPQGEQTGHPSLVKFNGRNRSSAPFHGGHSTQASAGSA